MENRIHEKDVVEKARQFRNKYASRGQFTGNFPEEYKKAFNYVVNQFNNGKIIKLDNLYDIKLIIAYMISAKLVGNNKLYNDLSSYTHNILDNFCEDLKPIDECNDGYSTAVERHVHAINEYIYTYLYKSHIRYIDAGIIMFNNGCIYLPEYDKMIEIPKSTDEVNTQKCINEIKKAINNSNNIKKPIISDVKLIHSSIDAFVYIDGKLKVTTEDSDVVDVDEDQYIYEYIIDEETDYNDIYDAMFRTTFTSSKSKIGSIATTQSIPLSKLHNNDSVFIKSGIVYHDTENKLYKVVGRTQDLKFIHYIKYPNLNSLDLVYSYTVNSTNKKKSNEIFVNKFNLGNLSKATLDIPFNNWIIDYGNEPLNPNLLYLYKGKTKIGEMTFREIIDFDSIKNLLDTFIG